MLNLIYTAGHKNLQLYHELAFLLKVQKTAVTHSASSTNWNTGGITRFKVNRNQRA